MEILVVDDEKSTCILLNKILSKYGYSVTMAFDGVEAFDILQEKDISFVISDWVMPNMNGLELCKKIRNSNFSKYIYTILLTSKNNKDELVQGMEAGADDFITKPFNVEELRVRVRAGERIIDLESKLQEKNKKLKDAYETMSKDIEAAAKLQESMLPPKDDNIIKPKITTNIDSKIKAITFDWMFLPSYFLAGDIFNIFYLDETNIGFYILDVAGHGVPASMLSVTLSKMLLSINNNYLKIFTNETPHYKILEPSEVMKTLNKDFQIDFDVDSMQYFTMIYGTINLITGKVIITQAGHPSPLYIQKTGEISLIGKGGVPIGLLENSEYKEDEFFLNSGDRIILYSDGIIECENNKRDIYSKDRFISFFAKSKDISLKRTISSLEKELIAWRGQNKFDDDLSLLAIEIL